MREKLSWSFGCFISGKISQFDTNVEFTSLNKYLSFYFHKYFAKIFLEVKFSHYVSVKRKNQRNLKIFRNLKIWLRSLSTKIKEYGRGKKVVDILEKYCANPDISFVQNLMQVSGAYHNHIIALSQIIFGKYIIL